MARYVGTYGLVCLVGCRVACMCVYVCGELSRAVCTCVCAVILVHLLSLFLVCCVSHCLHLYVVNYGMFSFDNFITLMNMLGFNHSSPFLSSFLSASSPLPLSPLPPFSLPFFSPLPPLSLPLCPALVCFFEVCLSAAIKCLVG